MPHLEPVAQDEYELICECGFQEYYSPSCSCSHCKATSHPISQCPECGAKVEKMVTKIEFTCTNGHVQVIEYKGLAREQAEFSAKLLDGSSPAYKFPPGPESNIGKCGICNAQLTSRVLDEPAGDSVRSS